MENFENFKFTLQSLDITLFHRPSVRPNTALETKQLEKETTEFRGIPHKSTVATPSKLFSLIKLSI